MGEVDQPRGDLRRLLHALERGLRRPTVAQGASGPARSPGPTRPELTVAGDLSYADGAYGAAPSESPPSTHEHEYAAEVVEARAFRASGDSEAWLCEWTIRLHEAPMLLRCHFAARVEGGEFKLKIGGSPRAVDGTTIASISESPSEFSEAYGLPFVKPSNLIRVKLIGKADIDTASIFSPTFAIEGV